MFNKAKRVVKAHANAALKKLAKSQVVMEARLPELKQEAVNLHIKSQEIMDTAKETLIPEMQERLTDLAEELLIRARNTKEQYLRYEAKLVELSSLRLILETRRELVLSAGPMDINIDDEIAAIERELAALDMLSE